MTALVQTDWTNEFTSATPVDGTLLKTTAGMMWGTKVATRHGWRAVETLQPGDMVLTFDNGLQPVAHVGQHDLMAAHRPRSIEDWPLAVPTGALGNLAPLILTPGQVVLIESDLAERMFADPFVAIPASCFDGINGISRVRPADQFNVCTLHFEEDQVVFGAGGVMFVCEGDGDLLTSSGQEAYPVLTGELAAEVLSEGVLPAGAEF